MEFKRFFVEVIDFHCEIRQLSDKSKKIINKPFPLNLVMIHIVDLRIDSLRKCFLGCGFG